MLPIPANAFRTPKDRLALVTSIVTAPPVTSEPEWVEWKTHPDLRAVEARFAVAKFILGAANRDPSKANRYAEGWAYFVLGAEPACASGTALRDSAQIQDWMEPYVGGSSGPAWDVHTVAFNGKSVLIFTVSPPRIGVGPFVLRKAFKNFHRGSIFVRKLGKTEPATPDDVAMLVRRAVPVAQLGVGVQAEAKLLRTIDASDEAFLDWRTREYEDIAQHWNRRPAHSFSVLDKRQDEYVSEVNGYLTRAEGAFLGRLQCAFLKVKGNLIRLTVVNATREKFKDVVLTISLPAAWIAAFDRDDIPGPFWPSRPSPQRDLVPPGLYDIPEIPARTAPPKEARQIGREDDRVVVCLAAFYQRPEARVELEFYAFPPRGESGTSQLQWSATATNVGDVARDEFDVEVDPTPLDWRSLLHNDSTQ